MWLLFILIGIFLWIIIPDEITKPVDEAVQNGIKKAVGYLKKGPKEPYEQ